MPTHRMGWRVFKVGFSKPTNLFMPCKYGIFYRGRKLRTHVLKSRTDALHHVRDLHALNPRAKLRIKKLRI